MTRYIGVILLAVLAWCTTISPARARAPDPKDQQACRIFALAYDRSFDRGSQTVFAMKGLRRFRKLNDPEILAILDGAPGRYGADLGALCQARYPRDGLIRKAAFPA